MIIHTDQIAPGAHLYYSELACHDTLHTTYPADLRETVLIPRLWPAFEGVRHRSGDHCLVITSGYRTPAWNAVIGGKPDDAHEHGEAIDYNQDGQWHTVYELARLAIEEAKAGGVIRGVGYYPDDGIVHMDTDIRRTQLTLWICVAITNPDGTPERRYSPWDGRAVR
jgi:hypothetical protein